MLIVYNVDSHRAWQPIQYMVKLAAELLEADLLLLAGSPQPELRQKLDAALWRRPKDETCLVVCRYATDLQSLFLVPSWRKRFRRIAAWVIDSFWVDKIPRMFRHTRPYDHYFITTDEDVAAWTKVTGTPTTCLPWGTDVLRLGSRKTAREWDLLRVGRQPPEWDSDSVVQEACTERGIRFHGRPGDVANPDDGQRVLMETFGLAKYAVAFSNRANPMSYTHPTREYLTARWVDALGSGTIPAGIVPKTSVADRILWPGATLELGTTGLDAGLQVIKEAVLSWRPEMAVEANQNALKSLDWRWRLATIAEDMGISPEPLLRELELVRQAAKRPDNSLSFAQSASEDPGSTS